MFQRSLWSCLVFFSGLSTMAETAAGNDQQKAKEPPDPLQITFDVPKISPTLAQVNQGKFAITVNFKNISRKDLVLWPYLSVNVQDANGKNVDRSRSIGRWGLIKSDSIIEDVPFLTLKAGQTHRLKVNIANYFWDADLITAWQLPAAGNYQVLLHYHYQKAEARKKYGTGCKDLQNAKKPWNRAVEMNKKMTVKLEVAKE